MMPPRRKQLLDAAEKDGRIDAATRPIYENLLAKDRENSEKALEKLSPKRRVMTDVRTEPDNEGRGTSACVKFRKS